MASEYIGVNGVARKVPTHYIGVDGVARNVKSGYVGVDGVARLFFAPEDGSPVILEVEKITSDTYDGSTTFTGEEFILLDIYPKNAGSKVNVTYGGFTKTITFTGTNAQPVFFGTFNGSTDSVATPASGTLTIDGQYKCFSTGSYKTYSSTSKSTTSRHCSCITAATDISGIEILPSYAFYGCSKVTDVQIPDKFTSIGSYAFRDCTGITLSELPSGITSIGDGAFWGCGNITFSKLPNGLTSIEDDTFQGCKNITLSKLPSGITSIGNSAFYGCENTTFSELPSGITSIGDHAFRGCENITLSKLPSGITSIGAYTFSYCTSITITELPNGITSIGDYAFYMYFSDSLDESYGLHSSLTSITIPETIQSIGVSAFSAAAPTDWNSNPPSVRKVVMLATTPPTLGSNAFGTPGYDGSGGDVEIIVPKGCGATYKAATGWSSYADQIKEAA